MTPPRRRRRAVVAVLLAVLGLVLASCTTVPTSSSPSIVRSVPLLGPSQPVDISPPVGADPRTIVQGFLDANAADDANHAAARRFLTPEARSRWSDATVTIIDRPRVGNALGSNVVVSGQEIGTLDSAGVYTPALRGDGFGTGGSSVSRTFGMRKVKGQWRIDTLQKGLLISQTQFEQQYQQRKIYFFDVDESKLVPDPRFTQLINPRDLAVWLVARLGDGPRGELQTGLPSQTDVKRVQVRLPSENATDPTVVEIPGSSQLDGPNRNRLAAQIGATLAQVPQISDIRITDGGQPVRIPAAGGTDFTAEQVVTPFEVTPPPDDLYYVDHSAVYQQNGRRLPGKVGTGAYGLSSVALTSRGGVLRVAGVRGSGKQSYLDIGTADQLYPTKVHGNLTRPAWAPGVNEVWIGDGNALYRVSTSGVVHTVPVDTAAGSAPGQIRAVRLSPEGARVALVMTGPDETSQVFVGSVVRGTSQVRVADLQPITPQGVSVTDVAWNDQLELFVIGTDLRTSDFGVYEVQSDGSLWTLRGVGGLPQAPDSITASAGAVAVVSTGPTIWRQQAGSGQAGSWAALVGDSTDGTNPIYLE